MLQGCFSSVSIIVILQYIPLGGSFVTLTAFCNTDTGNALVGIEDR